MLPQKEKLDNDISLKIQPTMKVWDRIVMKVQKEDFTLRVIGEMKSSDALHNVVNLILFLCKGYNKIDNSGINKVVRCI